MGFVTESIVKVLTTVVLSPAYIVNAVPLNTHFPKPCALAAFKASPTVLGELEVGTSCVKSKV